MKPIITVLTVIMLASACRTKEKDVAGKGGSATVNIFPQHHEIAKRLINFKLYIKYGTKDAPTSGVYDDSVICSNHDSLVSGTFTGLKNGDYYFYGYGYDTSINTNVHGGSPYTITSQAAQNFNLPVSE